MDIELNLGYVMVKITKRKDLGLYDWIGRGNLSLDGCGEILKGKIMEFQV